MVGKVIVLIIYSVYIKYVFTRLNDPTATRCVVTCMKYQNWFCTKNISDITPSYLQTFWQRVDDIFSNFAGQHFDVPYFNEECYSEFLKVYFLLRENNACIATFSDTRRYFRYEYIEWIPFRDIYVSLVHSNESLNKIQKFYFLKGNLAREATNLIKTISATKKKEE